jgi:hypothetical protein
MIFYNRQVTHNAHLYENQDLNVIKITNLTFKTDNWNFNELPNFWSQPTLIFFFDLTVLTIFIFLPF